MEKKSFVDAVRGRNDFVDGDEGDRLLFPKNFFNSMCDGDLGCSFLRKVDRKNGFPALIFSDEEISKLSEPFKYSLVGKFAGRRPNVEIIRKKFQGMNLSGGVSIGVIDGKHILIRLERGADYSYLFALNRFFVEGCQVKFLKWDPNFEVGSEPPFAPVWINLPGLRVHFFNKQILFSIASIFGKPLKIDLPTFNLSRPSNARVLVEVNVLESWSSEIWIGTAERGYWQRIEMENVPYYCTNCKCFGHLQNGCKRKLFVQEKDQQIDTVVTNLGSKDSVLNVRSFPQVCTEIEDGEIFMEAVDGIQNESANVPVSEELLGNLAEDAILEVLDSILEECAEAVLSEGVEVETMEKVTRDVALAVNFKSSSGLVGDSRDLFVKNVRKDFEVNRDVVGVINKSPGRLGEGFLGVSEVNLDSNSNGIDGIGISVRKIESRFYHSDGEKGLFEELPQIPSREGCKEGSLEGFVLPKTRRKRRSWKNMELRRISNMLDKEKGLEDRFLWDKSITSSVGKPFTRSSRRRLISSPC